MNTQLLNRAIAKAQQTTCRYKVVAVGFNAKGDCVGIACNARGIDRQGGSIHAEIGLLKRFKSIRNIVLIRTNSFGKLLPIEPCNTCRKILDKKGIEVKTIYE